VGGEVGETWPWMSRLGSNYLEFKRHCGVPCSYRAVTGRYIQPVSSQSGIIGVTDEVIVNPCNQCLTLKQYPVVKGVNVVLFLSPQ